jgi:hypothetical protein
VEEIFWATTPTLGQLTGAPKREQWMPERNRLGHLLVGLKADLPECAKLLSAATSASALDQARLAREEIQAELEYIDSVLSFTRNPEYYPAGTGLLAGHRVWPAPRKS